ncbi:hypothetical protein MMC19_005242 [Ptychographa xylographoides]|nr:hypothetical protein [Ptychographa xylographoides]
MPPFIPRKRKQDTPPSEGPTPKRAKKPSLFDTVDQASPAPSIAENRKFLHDLGGSDSETSLSDAESSDFEDVLPAKRRKVDQYKEEDAEIEWEDAIQQEASTPLTSAPGPSGDLELTISRDHRIGSLTNPHDKKKGPSKIERQIRTFTHCMHVQFLLFHNLTRNGWICDKEVQKILVAQLPDQFKKEVEIWRLASGLAPTVTEISPSALRSAKNKKPSQTRSRGRGGRGRNDIRSQREWGKPAERQERGMPNTSRGDPVIRLLKFLAAYWKKRFRITAPCLRKQGYKPLAVLEEEVASFHNDKHDPEAHGERIADLRQFRDCARICEGSRDVGAQLFTALIRGLGIEARLVASLQPIGYGWSKNEEANLKKKRYKAQDIQSMNGKGVLDDSDTDEGDGPADRTVEIMSRKTSEKTTTPTKGSSKGKKQSSKGKGKKDAPISLSDDTEQSSTEPLDSNNDTADAESVVDVTPSVLQRKANMNFDKDLIYPNYWTEVISPLTHEVYPVDSLILIPPVATKQEYLAAFEPRGAKADRAKQVMAYVIAYSADGTAKEVTTRYLKRHMWPGKTKSVRMPVEKVPILNKRGKVKHYEQYDWFKTVMSGYSRTDKMRTAVDDSEEEKDLKVVKPEKKEAKEGEETLQEYKQSAEYVLERHLRREEAILPGSEPVKTFTAGKGEKAKEEPVYLRKHVVVCRTGESWHKEGRQVKVGEYPMKMVPIRAVTLARKREVEEAEREGGEKMKQGLYAWDQTDWIIPPPIKDGVIPKNAFGNMDCFVPTMVPRGAIHIPLRGTMKICKRLGIDYAEAVTGFEFGNQRAVPVITGVVVASYNEDRVIEEWEKDEEERKIKEEGKRERAALSMWRKFLMGLRIIERVQEEYGGDDDAHVREEINPFTNKNKKDTQEASTPSSLHINGITSALHSNDEDMGGGFIVEAQGEDTTLVQASASEDVEDDQAGGGFVLDDSMSSPRSLYRLNMPTIDPHFEFATVSDPETKDIESGKERISKVIQQSKKSKVSNQITVDNGDPLHRTQTRKSKLKKKAHTLARSWNQEKSDLPNSGSESEAGVAHPPTKALARTAPKRTAARKSETAFKSHYFARSGTETDETASEGETDEEESGYEPAQRQRKGTSMVKGEPGKGRRGRPRKAM